MKQLVGRKLLSPIWFLSTLLPKIEWKEDIEKTKIVFVTREYRFNRKVRIKNLGDNKMPTEKGG